MTATQECIHVYSEGEEIMVLTISDEEFVQIKMIVLDSDEREALHLLKELLKRLEQQRNLGLKSHLDQGWQG
jgi:hypothetical protein